VADAKHYVHDPRVLSIDVTPNPVVVKKNGSVQVTATVRTKDISSLQIWLGGPKGNHHGDGHWLAKRDVGTANYDKARYDAESRSWTITWGDRTGSWNVHVEAIGVNGKRISADRSFLVKHQVYVPRPQGSKATRIAGFDATPEPVRKGRTLALKGKLEVAQCYGGWYYKVDGIVSVFGRSNHCYDSHAYWHDWHWLGKQDLGVYFLPKGSHHWKYVGKVESHSDGSFYTRVRAFQSGTWSVKFNGTRHLKGSQASDYVQVVR
jgi:hypothetical protein